MDPQLQQALAEWLTALLTQAEKAGDFALAQAPLVIQEKILYARVSSTLGSAAMLLAVGGAALMAYRSRRIPCDDERNPEAATAWGVFAVLLTIPLAMVIDHALVAWLAPRVYILHWLRSLIAG